MDTPDKNTIGDSRGNSLSSGDPNLKSNEKNTSTDSTSNLNTGESAPQQGEDIVNEQEQHKSVNTEEYIENSAQIRFDDYERTQVANNKSSSEPSSEITNKSDATVNKPTNMEGGVL